MPIKKKKIYFMRLSSDQIRLPINFVRKEYRHCLGLLLELYKCLSQLIEVFKLPPYSISG